MSSRVISVPTSRRSRTEIARAGASGLINVVGGPVWGLRIEDGRVYLVLKSADLPGGATLDELVLLLPHVGFPFDFREGLGRFRDHRGDGRVVQLGIEARVLLDWLHTASDGRITGRALDDSLVLLGRLESGTRYTVRARIVPDPAGIREEDDEPSLVLSLFDIRVYGVIDEPWPLLASRILDLLPASLVVERTLTTARLRVLRKALAWALSGMAWKLPDLSSLRAQGVEVRGGRLIARFATPDEYESRVLTLDLIPDAGLHVTFQRFVEDLELKRHHGQIDRLLAAGQVREALAEVYRSLDGRPRPGFLAQRLVGIASTRPVLYDEGERVARGLLADHPRDAPSLCALASIALGRGRSEEAAVFLERLSGVLVGPGDREDATACDLLLADALAHTDARASRAALGRVLERSPDHEEALDKLIALAEDDGDDATAVPLYKRLLFAARSTERTREAGLKLARHALSQEQAEEARVYLRVVLEASPGDLEAKLALADVERQEGNYDAAALLLEASLRTVGSSDPDPRELVEVVRRLASLAAGPLGEPSRARRVLWRANDIADLTAEQSLELARLSLSAKEGDLVDRYTGRIDDDDALWPRAACLRARARLAAGDPQAALAEVLRVVERCAGDQEALELLELCAGDPEAREGLLHTLKLAAKRAKARPDRARVHRTLGRLYESLDLDWDAIGPYEAAMRDGSGEIAFLVAERLLELYGRFGMWTQHQGLVRRLLAGAEDPRRKLPLLVRGGRVALLELQRPDIARRFLSEAVDLAPRRTAALELLRDALEQIGDWPALVPVLRRLAAVHANARVKVNSLLRLAELQVDSFGALSQARATLKQLPDSEGASPRLRALNERLASRPRPARPKPVVVAPPVGPTAYERALKLADRGDVEAAVRALQAELGTDPPNIPALELGWVLARDVQPAKALPFGERLHELYEDHEDRQRVLEELLAATMEPLPERALHYARRLLAVAPGHAAASSVIEADPLPDDQPGSVGSLPAPLAAAVAEGDRLELLMDTASAALLDGRHVDAQAALDEALELDGDHLGALELRAELTRTLGDWEALVVVLERLAEVAFDANQTLAHTLERANILADRLRDLPAAVAGWERYLELMPLDEDVSERLGGYYREERRYDRLAALHAARAEAIREDDLLDEHSVTREVVRARLDEARVRLHDLHDPDGAIAALEEPRELAGDEPEVLECVVRALAAGNRRTECRETVAKLLPMLLPGPLRDEMELLLS